MAPRTASADSYGATAGGSGSGSFYDDSEGGGSAAKRVRRKPVTCAQCRKRKLRCDRGNPCSACRERGEGDQCEWEGAVRLPNTTYTREDEALELRTQLERLEGLLAILDSPVEDDSEEQGHRRKDSLASESDGVPSTPASRRAGGLFASAGPSETVEGFARLLPPRAMLDTLVDTILAQEAPFLPILHVPTFRERYQAFEPSLASSQPFLLALVLALAEWAGQSTSMGKRMNSADSALLDAAMHTLIIADYMGQPSLDALRTLIVLHQIRATEHDPSAGFLRASAVQLALTLGLNLDPSACPSINCIEAEERRRIWHVLVSQEWTGSSGRTIACPRSSFDTKFPANAFDVDVNSDGITESPFPSNTPTLYLSYLFQIASTARAITEQVFAVRLASQLTWGRIIDLNAELLQIESSFPNAFALQWQGDVLQPLPREEIATEIMRVRVRLLLLQQHLRLNRPFLTRGFADPRFGDARLKCCSAAHQILSIFRGFADDHPLSLGPDLTFHALNALCILAIDLFQDPQGSAAEGARRQISSTFSILGARQSDNFAAIETMRIAEILVAQSISMAKRKHDEQSPLGPSTPLVGPLPIPMSVDPFASRTCTGDADGLGGLWTGLSKLRRLYAVPDAREWAELCKGSRAWEGGLDVLC